MALPFFYIPTYDPANPEITLDEDNSRHIIQVLRMQPGEALQLTDGKGALLTAVIADDHKKKCRVSIRSAQTTPSRSTNITIAISPLKNASRFEWFLEKAAEIGVTTIIPLLCERTERQSIRTDRLQNILVSALLQSQQTWLSNLSEPTPFETLIRQTSSDSQRLIAHCLEAPKATISLAALERPVTDNSVDPSATLSHGQSATVSVNPGQSTLILIGPEGDFSSKEVETALTAGYLPVSLGQNRLRTETAGVVAASLLCIK